MSTDLGVTSGQFDFVDTTRPTAPFGAYPGSASRLLSTTVWFPANGGGPYPLVVFAHGYAVTPADYAPLLSRIAASGYVVAAPTYPLLSGEPAGPTEAVGWDDLYADTWFVTTSMLDLSAAGSGPLAGMVDPARIAVAGHSDGALLSFADGFTPFRLDPRLRAVVSYAAIVGQWDVYQPNGRPFLHVLSDQDAYNSYPRAIAWDRESLQEPRTILTLWNASHGPPFMDPNDAHFGVVARTTVGFLDAHLKAQPLELFKASMAVADRPDLAMVE